MIDVKSKIFFDGKFVNFKDAKIGILTHSLHYGSSVFEGIRAYETLEGPAIFRLKEHIERLFYSAESLFMKLDYSIDEIMQKCKDVIRLNNLKSAYIRPIIFYGDESMGINPTNCKVHIAIIAWQWGKYLNDEVSVMISAIRRISEKTTVVDAKIGGHYVNSIFATIDAKKNGFDEALLLDHNNYIGEGPGENIFFIKDKKIITPKLGKILQGITRDSVIRILKDMDYQVEEKNIKVDDLKDFDSAFFTGTAAEISPISKIDDIVFDVEKVKDISEKFFEIVEGKNKRYNFWLNYIN